MAIRKDRDEENRKRPEPTAGGRPASGKTSPAKGREAAPQPQGAVAGLTGKVAEFREFFEQSKVELKKVTWPTRKETVQTGMAVLIFSVIMSIYLGVVDLALAKIVELILS